MASLALSPVVQAQDVDGPVIELDAIVITAPWSESAGGPFLGSKPSTTLAPRPGVSPHDSAADLVGRTTGVHRRQSGVIEEGRVSIRGSGSAQVQVYLDGVPLETASGEGVGLGLIGAEGLARVEIFKSFAPVEFGADAIGGVISLRSRPIRPGFGGRFALSAGSFTTISAGAETSYGGQANDVSLRVQFQRTAGDFSFLDDNGTPLNPADDATVSRRNNEQQLIHPQLTWQHRLDDRTRFTFTTHVFRLDRGVPGLQNFQSTSADKSLTEWLGQGEFRREGLAGGSSSLSNTVYFRVIKSQFSDPAGEIGLGAAQDNDNDTLVLGDRFLWRTDLNRGLALRAAAEYTFEWFRPEDFAAADPTGSASSRQQISLTAEPFLRFFGDRLALTPQARFTAAFYDLNNDDPSRADRGTFFLSRTETQVSGRLGASWTPPLPGLTFKAAGGRMVRLPRFGELFGDQGTVLGNPQLNSESAWQFDGGLLWQKAWRGGVGGLDDMRLEANYFESHLQDLIQFEIASGIARADNVGEAVVRGAEAVVAIGFARHFRLTNNYTYQRALDRGTNPGRRLVGRPEHELHSELACEFGPVSSALKLAFLDNQYLDALNTQKVNNRLELAASAAWLIKRHYRLGVEVRNLTDTQIVDAIGFPLPGRAVYGRLDVTWD